MGVFIIIGGLEYVGVINYIGSVIGDLAPNDSFLTFLMILWLSAFLSSVIDNVPVTRILLPTIDILARDYKPTDTRFFYSGMTYGVNMGDNLVPVGDVILVMSIAKKQNIYIKPINYFKIAFPITIIQLLIISVLFSLLMRPLLGILILISASGLTLLIFTAIWLKNNRIKR
jgi:Na+/H+ antiporter NhaD/arsenite permease-like protein